MSAMETLSPSRPVPAATHTSSAAFASTLLTPHHKHILWMQNLFQLRRASPTNVMHVENGSQMLNGRLTQLRKSISERRHSLEFVENKTVKIDRCLSFPQQRHGFVQMRLNDRTVFLFERLNKYISRDFSWSMRPWCWILAAALMLVGPWSLCNPATDLFLG
jgi:hypothetical protein